MKLPKINLVLRAVVWLALAAMLPAGCSKLREVRLETVSLRQWQDALAQQTGKIVVADTWATWCAPCKEDFPKLVALQQKYAPQNVVFMSVSVDAAEDSAAALEFLKQHEANFANYRIEDQENAWYDRWKMKGIPVVLVFGPDGTLARKFDMDDPDHQFTYGEVEQQITDMLKAADGQKTGGAGAQP